MGRRLKISAVRAHVELGVSESLCSAPFKTQHITNTLDLLYFNGNMSHWVTHQRGKEVGEREKERERD